jgi:hypothetical protein
MRRLFLLALIALIVVACSTDDSASTTAADGATVAPDFSLALGDGSTFTLSEEARPVFMVFWAEW